MKSNKKITAHIHNRIAKLAVAAIERGDITSCDRIPDTESYLIVRSLRDGTSSGYLPTTYTALGAGTLLYLLNSFANS
ncbi:MAG: hypothetical protein EAZ73_09190 [Oscillatoriales cyanobacterium]|uniref:hypothetical protein n=1 Tax=unclassified Microcoleus TaxID=2642155 RepID=UPI001E0551C8|nr:MULTISPECIES: hypothetical protein [unclassified Microcoleus]TAF00851.1 MAG: hypothetical protein EAZ79_01405 [Oscillatoriales cyanobacterium]MCC3459811.1 hypothetical protein [Microcoleus sp. PH2017_11_PCY_U_A]MCC3478245.1 hypothetical protein [Microcoleus sp. PH2017_12_PCY_D_A]TAF21390.1 MAG: hypothetical protein EAZ73_09190 [Oscillatoriales cyanobacterium]TAF39683.1 MAG: hypothetical protein EAZ69_00155 [Oscillatoriales cyanobacterium]